MHINNKLSMMIDSLSDHCCPHSEGRSNPAPQDLIAGIHNQASGYLYHGAADG